ncbi:MAG TPA: 50S ribosomal protein L29 [Nitrososphaerales archaeon]|nr:50S ribosomal protein L29 [Nitrososphaerales archaeon]
MAQLKAKNLRELDDDKLREQLFQLRSELSKLQGNAARGMAQKEVGKIRRARRDVAIMLTVMKEKGVRE